MTAVVVTGFVPIPDHPNARRAESLGVKLAEITAAPIHAFRCEIAECWLAQVNLDGVAHSTGDNPRKNTMAYHIAQHQKTAWIAQVASEHEADLIVWIDYGICHIAGITPSIIDDFLRRLDRGNKLIRIPGIWQQEERTDAYPDWRFCGGVLVMPRVHAAAFHVAVQDATLSRIKKSSNVTWEVNDWAVVERQQILPIHWYQADHDVTMFTGYRDAR